MDSTAGRKALRARLMAMRRALACRDRLSEQIGALAAGWLEGLGARTAGLWWPICAEPDIRPAIGLWLERSPLRMAALPVIRSGQMFFARWTPGCPMAAGFKGIPEPATLEAVVPDALLVPCLGYDGACFRLGYGGGWYDRTLASMARRPAAAGVAFSCCRLETISPQPHDVALDAIITECGLETAGLSGPASPRTGP